MPFNYPDALKSINAMVLDDSGVYTPEMLFMLGAVNRLTCMGGPNYNPGTNKILDTVLIKRAQSKP
jgi:hypothetical protein